MTPILFYTSIPRSFRTTLIGHLYKLASVYPVVLLSEDLDQFTEEIVKNKKLFPKLEEIIPIHQHTGEKRSLLAKNKELATIAREVIEKYRPRIVITANDLYLFEMYLFREAGKIGAAKICLQAGLAADSTKTPKWLELIEAELNYPKYLPLFLRRGVIKLRKIIGHFLYYWLLPLLNLQKPFFGRSSYILRRDESGMREADYQAVFNDKEWSLYRKSGVPEKKLLVLPHPLITDKRFFNHFLTSPLQVTGASDRRVALIVLPGDIEVSVRRNFTFVPNERRLENWKKLLHIIDGSLPDWKIVISTHPATKNYELLKTELESVSPKIEMLELNGPVESYLKSAEAIIGFPPSLSTLLFAASLQYPRKPIFSLDPYRELMGDYYKDFPGIDYTTSKIDLEEKLKALHSGKYKKRAHGLIPLEISRSKRLPPSTESGSLTGLTHEGFKNSIELVQHVLDQNPSHSRPIVT